MTAAEAALVAVLREAGFVLRTRTEMVAPHAYIRKQGRISLFCYLNVNTYSTMHWQVTNPRPGQLGAQIGRTFRYTTADELRRLIDCCQAEAVGAILMDPLETT